MNQDVANYSKDYQLRSLFLSTLAFIVCFAVWTVFSIIGVTIKRNLQLTDTEFGILIAMPILTGSISRIFFGVWSDQYGGRLVFTLVMLASAVSTLILLFLHTYMMYLLAALGVGLAGGSFAVGIVYVSKWYPKEKIGTALGIFGAGNVGAVITHFVAPLLLIALGWKGVAAVYAAVLFVMAIVFWVFSKDDPELIQRRQQKIAMPSILQRLAPLKKLQVWRFSLYYFFTFGGFVALALWLPFYYTTAYGLTLKTAGMLSALYSLPGSIFRILGGWLSDKIGARKIMYIMFTVCGICTFILAIPPMEFFIRGVHQPLHFTMTIPLIPFVITCSILGFFMSLGNAAVYKHVPVYYPEHVGAVGGMVGMIGALGGFILPIVFGMMTDLMGIWTVCFMLLWLIIVVALIWMHFAILAMEKKKHPDLRGVTTLPGLGDKKD